MPKSKEEVRKLELPPKWQLLQLYSLHTFAGALVACISLSWEKIEKIITNGLGTQFYAVMFACFVIAGILSGFIAGTKGLQLLIHLIRITKNLKEDE